MSERSEPLLDKGGAAEEALRLYFQRLGAFVVRGAKIRAGRDHVTDIDLWVYTRSSVHTRHVAIVDIKNKRKAKAYERLIWLRGLQEVVGADEAIVATSTAKDDAKPLAARLGIKVLSNQVFRAVVSKYENDVTRLSSEELDSMWRSIKMENGANLFARMETNLVELGLGLGFAALNVWIDEARALLIFCHDHERTPGPVLRAVCLCASLVAIAADYLLKDVAFDSAQIRSKYFKEGLLFGKPAEGIAERYLAFAEQLATEYLDKSGAAAARMRIGFKKEIEDLPISSFIDFFARPVAGRELMDAALQLEALAFARDMKGFQALSSEGKTIIGLLIDYAGLDRRRFFQNVLVMQESTDAPESEKMVSKNGGEDAMKNAPEAKLL